MPKAPLPSPRAVSAGLFAFSLKVLPVSLIPLGGVGTCRRGAVEGINGGAHCSSSASIP